MNIGQVTVSLFVCGAMSMFAHAQVPTDYPDVSLKQALRYGDLYNWADAASLFTQAEQQFSARGDSRNAFYARLGRLRSTMEQLSLPEVSEQLGLDLANNPPVEI